MAKATKKNSIKIKTIRPKTNPAQKRRTKNKAKRLVKRGIADVKNIARSVKRKVISATKNPARKKRKSKISTKRKSATKRKIESYMIEARVQGERLPRYFSGSGFTKSKASGRRYGSEIDVQKTMRGIVSKLPPSVELIKQIRA